jgi:hypothetical protein
MAPNRAVDQGEDVLWNSKPDTSPLGVPLGDLAALLAPTSIKAEIRANTLLARHAQYTVRIEVVAPENRGSENGPIRAVVRMTTPLPKALAALFENKAVGCATFNTFAALGALTSDGGDVHVGSRLTLYEPQADWPDLHLPLLLFTTIGGPQATFGAIRRSLTDERHRTGRSKWTVQDLAQVEGLLCELCVCTTRGLGLTAEFGLTPDAPSEVAADRGTALFQLMADQPHPELGGGLLCLLQMPHQVPDEQHLQQVCLQLNNLEMAAQDLPPHFGAWCPGRLGRNPAYVSFLPNALHAASGIAVSASLWAMSRAQWANTILPTLGVSRG